MIKAYFSKYSERDQKILIGSAALVAVWASYMVIINPLLTFKTRQEADLIAHTELLSFMRASAAEIHASGGAGKRIAVQDANSSVVVVIENVFRQKGLTTPTSIEPKGGDKAIIQYDQVDFNALIASLSQLKDTYGVMVESANFTHREAPGEVGAKLSFTRAN